ncbi:BaeS Signal transduction histidine kinase [Comamonadaceae bacterium]
MHLLHQLLTRNMSDYEIRDTARHFAQEAPFPYVSASIKALVCAWLMSQSVSAWVVLAWTLFSAVAGVAHGYWLKPLRDQLESQFACQRILTIVALSSLSLGVTWGSFTWLYFDLSNTTSVLMSGSVVAGTVGSAAAPLAIFLPAYYLIVVPTLAPLIFLLCQSHMQEHWILAGLTFAFFCSTAGYAHISQRVHRETMRLRKENRHLIKDLSKRKAAAESASHAKSLFLAGISHDLKQPLRAIALYMGVLRHRFDSRADQDSVQIADKVAIGLHDIHGQISRLLELSQLESGAMAVHIRPLPLEELFEKLQALFGPQAEAQGIRLVFAKVKARRQSTVLTDRQMLDSVLQNLISNAIKHTARGVVYVGTRQRTQYPSGAQLCIEVRDSGSGIPPERQPLLFDAYRSFDDRRASNSHGLGLALAKAQASYMGCDIALRSDPGAGTTFTICGLTTHLTP